jgi:sugar-specific transcriptional regulator TrmB
MPEEQREKSMDLLKKIGLSDYERNLYFCLLRYGPLTAGKISKYSKIPRSKVYEVTLRLVRKGFVREIPKTYKQKTLFIATNPDNIFSLLFSETKETLSYFNELYSQSTKDKFPSFSIISSREDVKELFVRIVNDSKSILFYLTNLGLKRVLGFTFDTRLKTLKKKTKGLIISDNQELIEFSKLFLKTRTKTIKKESMGGLNFIIVDDKVILDLLEPQHFMIEITSKDAVNTFTNIFNLLWKN